MTQQSIQLEMDFERTNENHFKKHLDKGTFQILVELPIPSADTPIDDAVHKYAEFEHFIHSQTDLEVQIAFVNDTPAGYSLDPIEFVSKLYQNTQDRDIIYLNGMNRSVREIKDMIGHAVSLGFHNFCTYCGTPPANMDETAIRSCHFAESTNILNSLQQNNPSSLFVGTVINPYQYTMSSAYAQSFHMFRDIANGASFIVTRFGWDAMKLQEVIWNLYRNDVNIPIIAGLAILTQENAEAICAGKIPGVHLSPDFVSMLKQERTHSAIQFQAAQLRRLQIHAAGAKLLGYNAIQLNGTTNIEYLTLAFKRIREALNEFRTFDDWRAAYMDYYDQMPMIPYPNNYYMFGNLLQKEQLESAPGLLSSELPKLSRKERFSHKIAQILFKHADVCDSSEKKLTKRILVQCHSCNQCTLPQTDFICSHACPMGLLNGSCGLNNADGTCFINGNECVFAKRIRYADKDKDFSSLTEGCVGGTAEQTHASQD